MAWNPLTCAHTHWKALDVNAGDEVGVGVMTERGPCCAVPGGPHISSLISLSLRPQCAVEAAGALLLSHPDRCWSGAMSGVGPGSSVPVHCFNRTIISDETRCLRLANHNIISVSFWFVFSAWRLHLCEQKGLIYVYLSNKCLTFIQN